MNSVIHLIEGTAFLLFCALIFQVYRCYQSYCQAIEAQAAKRRKERMSKKAKRSFNIQVNIPSRSTLKLPVDYVDSESKIESSRHASVSGALHARTNALQHNKVTEDYPVSELDSNTESAAAELPLPDNSDAAGISVRDSLNDQILNDYIGEFFADSTENLAANIDAYRVANERAPAPANKARDHEQAPTLLRPTKIVEEEADSGHTSLEDLASTLSSLDQPAPSLEPQDGRLPSTEIEPAEAEDLSDSIPLLNSVAEDFEDADDQRVQLDEVITVESIDSDVANGKSTQPVASVAPKEPLASDNDEDAIIVVGEAEDEQETSKSVMSDKVVHAMLDEAKLICAS